MKRYLKNIGPGAIITAAFIGPGTITTCIKSGYETEYSLLGIMIVAILVAITIQIFAAKIGIITQIGISRNIRENIHSKIGKVFSSFMIVIGIFVGNSAFEAGNITGAVIGLTGIIGNGFVVVKVFIISAIVFALLWFGKYKKIEKILQIAVLIMAVCFIVAAILAKPDIGRIFVEMFDFKIISKNIMMIGALVGTTVGPYSIFLHSETAAERWHSSNDIKYMIFDTIVSIGVGGIISCSIVIVAATTAETLHISELSINNYVKALSNPIGNVGQFVFYLGLLAAGITSAITAPLAAAYTVGGICFSQRIDKQGWKFRMIWGLVLCIGALISIIWGNSPTDLIVIVQFVNAIILPLIMIFLYVSLNNNKMGKYRNRIWENFLLIIIIIICILLSVRNIYYLFNH